MVNESSNPTTSGSPSDGDGFDIIVVGGGIIGLATAWQLLTRGPGSRVVVVEAEADVAAHQTSHNSGVLHAGIYYAPGSLKAVLCARGRGLMEQFCLDHDIPIDFTGKLVVAISDAELPGLARLYDRSMQNGVPGLRRVDRQELRQIEPAAEGVAAIHSPRTGVVDFAAVARQLAVEVVALGGTLLTSWPVESVTSTADGCTVTGVGGAVLRGHQAVVCAGLQADRLAGEAAKDVRILPFRGSWYRVAQPLADRIRGSIYPVPDPSLPFLGVHLTRRINGEVWAGPNAFLAFSRRTYKPWAITPRDSLSSLGYPGFWRFAAGNLGTAWTEFSHDVSAGSYAKSLRQYVPEVQASDLHRGPMGIRAQAMDARGTLIDDFLIRRDHNVLHVLNAPSPAATSSFAIGEHLADAIEEATA
ncbi:L-2-hydroxyglutarate oxidase [Lacisediminihabitans sp. FW035]